MSETKPKTKIKGNLTPLAVFLANGKKDGVFYTDKKVNHIHTLAKHYEKVVICKTIDAIDGGGVIKLTKVVII